VAGKKNIFEKLGLIEPVPEEEKEMDFEGQEEEVPELEHIPDLTVDQETYGEPVDQAEAVVEEDPVVEPRETKEITEGDASEDIKKRLDELIGNYEKNRLMTIEEIYRNARLSNEAKGTIFMADVYMKTLPENLPADIKRESVLNILNVSSIDKEDLLNDAYQRIDSLNKVLESTVQTTEEITNKNEATIRELEQRIRDLRKAIDDRHKFQEDQNTLIEYEIQRIINIVDFIKPQE
jgi:hypothetical protein